MDKATEIVTAAASVLSDWVLVPLLLAAAVAFTILTRGVQFRMAGEMLRLLAASGRRDTARDSHHSISSFQAFAVSIASRVGTGNLAGVASAIAIGGPGAVFWMWVIALLGAATAFAESTLAQLFKRKGAKSFIGGPAYYILHGLHNRPWAVTFAILITLTFGFAFNSVQANTIADAMHTSFALPAEWVSVALMLLTLAIICGGIQRISRFSEIIVPVMAIGYIILAVVIVAMNIHRVPEVLALIFENAFGVNQAVGGSVGVALVMGIKRGLFSNEAGEGSTPNAAATASVSHPVKQGLVQTLGVYVDTLLVCTATAFIILCSGVFDSGLTGIELTQCALEAEIGRAASAFVAVAVVLFAFTSIIANYYYGETNLAFIRDDRRLAWALRAAVGVVVLAGAIVPLNTAWALADITMALMTLCNMLAILLLGRYAIRCLDDYCRQRRAGRDPVYHSSTCPEIAGKTECWK